MKKYSLLYGTLYSDFSRLNMLDFPFSLRGLVIKVNYSKLVILKGDSFFYVISNIY